MKNYSCNCNEFERTNACKHMERFQSGDFAKVTKLVDVVMDKYGYKSQQYVQHDNHRTNMILNRKAS